MHLNNPADQQIDSLVAKKINRKTINNNNNKFNNDRSI